MINTSGITPVGVKVLILPDPVEEKTSGGIYLAETTKSREEYKVTKATLVSKGGNAFEDIDPKPALGDRLYIAVNTGYYVYGKDGVKYKMILDVDVVGIFTE